MLVLGLEFVDLLPAVVRAFAVEVDAWRVVLEDALRSLHAVDAAVGTGAGHVVLEQDHASLRGPDERSIEIAIDVLLLPLWRIFRLGLFAPFREAELFGTHRYQVVEPVAAVHIHIEGDRA